MRLMGLKEFRSRFYMLGSEPAISTLRARIKSGKLPGGILKDGKYLVDTAEFRAAYDPYERLLQEQQMLLQSGHLFGLVPGAKSPPKARKRRPARTRVVTEAERRLSAAHARKRKRIIRQATPAWANLAAIAAFYAEARRKTEQTGISHCVDHRIPLQGRLVCGLHVETNLRVVTVMENSRKHNRFGDDHTFAMITEGAAK